MSYITREGYEALQAELNRLWTQERPKVTREVQEAAAHGDRSENAEYIYGKRRLREIDRKLQSLTKRLEKLTVVDPAVGGLDRVRFGVWVRLEDEDGEERRYRVVGPDESRPEAGWISMESPIGRALMGRRVGDEVVVNRPIGTLYLEVLAIEL